MNNLNKLLKLEKYWLNHKYLWMFPFVSYSDKRDLPQVPGVYLLAEKETKEILYVGSSKNLKRRWATHHLAKYAREKMSDPVIIYIETKLTRRIESYLVHCLGQRIPLLKKISAFSLTTSHISLFKQKWGLKKFLENKLDISIPLEDAGIEPEIIDGDLYAITHTTSGERVRIYLDDYTQFMPLA
ncbi:MAG: GIY-YIG nuclease family protein [Microcoleaceae cyanobacterium]